MNIRRIRVFLGGYVNFLNAQNINCRSLSEHLDNNKFEVWTMLLWNQNAQDFQRISSVHYLKSRRPVRFLGWFPYLIGLFRCDVAYLPKREYVRFCRLVARLSGCKVFTTLEGVLDEELLSRQQYPNQYVEQLRSYEPNLYSISKFMAYSEKKLHGLQCRERILYLGTNTDRFLKEPQCPSELAHIVMIGNDLNRKKASEFVKMATFFPKISFHIIGGNEIEGLTVEEYIGKHGMNNVFYHGSLNHSQLSELLSKMNLMFFPSRSEGFPKVMLETACAGIPTLCYGDYGADEWITTGKDGFVVNTFDEAKAVIQQLVDHPEQLQELSKNAIELGKHFDWKALVKDWEDEIIKITDGRL
ncbi:MAG: glycosyltransferase family 4 protein [Bacteroidales bacterium]|nr:glycosyltransferase family 4 protein [Bacteroidales bacterium]